MIGATPGRWIRLGPPLAGAAMAGLGCVAIAVADPTNPDNILPVCPTRSLFGVVCPGCGSLRMIYSLLRGDLASAVRYNAVGVLVILLVLWSWTAGLVGRFQDRRIRTWEHWRWSAVIAAVVVLVWAVVRNLPFPPFESLRV